MEHTQCKFLTDAIDGYSMVVCSISFAWWRSSPPTSNLSMWNVACKKKWILSSVMFTNLSPVGEWPVVCMRCSMKSSLSAAGTLHHASTMPSSFPGKWVRFVCITLSFLISKRMFTAIYLVEKIMNIILGSSLSDSLLLLSMLCL